MCFMGLSLALRFSNSNFSAFFFSSCLVTRLPNASVSGMAPIVALRGRPCLGESGGLANSKPLSFDMGLGEGAGEPSGDV